ncbi:MULTISPECIES: SAM-dependent methyltransferase [unclassified Nocardia]|uniref:SAM-dependent methyltransferase n=1 Tax=unclassified Nocardia TaxID=2637762 RepID=UPI0024A86250|nr:MULTISPECIES: SAM-dependent methyltransferase [unclassified Nocardia]
MTTLPDWAPPTVDPTVPCAARIYDYCVGGMHNFEVDREFVRRGSVLWPELPSIMRANRAFLRRATLELSRAGVRQFLDIGSGIPTSGNVHEVVQALDPAARVAYVDIDPVAVSMSRSLLTDVPNTVAVHGDFRSIDDILADPDIRGLIDFDQPVAVLLVAILHFIPDSADPAGLIARIRDALPKGSYLALSHFSSDGPPEAVRGVIDMTRATPTPLQLRPYDRVRALFDGFELLEPGLVTLERWRPDTEEPAEPATNRFHDYAGVGMTR